MDGPDGLPPKPETLLPGEVWDANYCQNSSAYGFSYTLDSFWWDAVSSFLDSRRSFADVSPAKILHDNMPQNMAEPSNFSGCQYDDFENWR